MPRIDPITGVPCLTHFEFMQKEAEHNGRSLEEEIEADNIAMEEAYQEEVKHTTDNALAILREAVEQENQYIEENNQYSLSSGDTLSCDPPLPLPVEVKEIRSMSVPHPMASHAHTRIEAYCLKDDGSEGMLVYDREYWSGSRIDPPDEEVNVYWEEASNV